MKNKLNFFKNGVLEAILKADEGLKDSRYKEPCLLMTDQYLKYLYIEVQYSTKIISLSAPVAVLWRSLTTNLRDTQYSGLNELYIVQIC